MSPSPSEGSPLFAHVLLLTPVLGACFWCALLVRWVGVATVSLLARAIFVTDHVSSFGRKFYAVDCEVPAVTGDWCLDRSRVTGHLRLFGHLWKTESLPYHWRSCVLKLFYPILFGAMGMCQPVGMDGLGTTWYVRSSRLVGMTLQLFIFLKGRTDRIIMLAKTSREWYGGGQSITSFTVCLGGRRRWIVSTSPNALVLKMGKVFKDLGSIYRPIRIFLAGWSDLAVLSPCILQSSAKLEGGIGGDLA